ncbi:MAG TPA: sialidase family protein [Candidatus Thermoplasmatota archaeon]|jgi:hypothetical protein|nr:sialidase family protein [Candidatus Thermoplasmatota archaeon]
MRAPALLLLVMVLAGCLGPAAPPPAPGPQGPLGSQAEPITFTEPKLLSTQHAGGEPAIVVTPRGTLLLASHPGYTHTHGVPSPGLLTSTTYESYMWRSTDLGATWAYVGLAGAPAGPRGLARGISDPDFAVDAQGRVFFTDLNALATDSVARSDDDGQTWVFGNSAVQMAVDRQWIAAYQDSVWISGNTVLSGEQVMRSDDGGLTWTEVGQAHLGGKLSSDPNDGTLYIGNGARVDVSTDGGATWTVSEVPDHENSERELGQVAVDGAGNIYTAWAEGHDVWLAASTDKAATWRAPVRLTSAWVGATNGTHIWPWVTAGDAGKVAVVWYAADESVENAQAVQGDWVVMAALLPDALAPLPEVKLANATGPIHTGPVCLGGTGCQTDQLSPEADRRLGDLFEAAITLDGRLAIAYSDTATQPGDSVSHPGFVLQLTGPRLRSQLLG